MDRIMTDKVAEKTENKVSDSDLKKQASEDEARLNARARKFRHIGFGIFGGLAALLVGLLLYSALTGYAAGEVYDPFTGERVEAK
jgi:hypothetical protein